MQRPRMVETADDVAEFWRWLSAQPWVAFDTETSGLDPFFPKFRVRIIQFGTTTDAWVLNADHWKGLIADVFRRYEGFFVAHNSRYDILALERWGGIEVPWHRVHDTMIAMRLAEPTESAALKAATKRHVSAGSANAQFHLNEAMKRQGWDFDTVPIDFPPYLFYAALDTILTARLFETDAARAGMASPVYPLEMQTRSVCTRMESNGMRVNRAFCLDTDDSLGVESDGAKARAESTYGLRLTSNGDLGRWLLDSDARPHLTKTTDGGQISVDREVLQNIVYHCPGTPAADVAGLALMVRRVDKVRGTYIRNFLDYSDGDGMLHPQIETLAARTGRMSIRTPALQTLPKRSEDPAYKTVRQSVIPYEDDHVLISVDFDQIELRLIAALSEDVGLIDAFHEADAVGSDFFTEAARNVYDDPDFKKTDPRRAPVKNFFYSAAYGAGIEKMAVTAGVPVVKMHEIRNSIADTYPGFFTYGTRCQYEAQGTYEVKTAYGRRLMVDRDRVYTALNCIIQGTAADVMKQSLVNLASAGLEDMLIVPVHDEVLMSVPRDQADEVLAECSASMTCHDFVVPLTVEGHTGETWGRCR